jgi:hypothetical protein
MARLPQASDLRRRPAPADSPDVRVGRIDYGPMARGAGAIADGVRGLAGAAGKAIEVGLDVQGEVDDYETRKRLLDFKLSTEMALEEHKRSMQPGGAGYSSAWREQFRERAAEFVGDKDANIPERLRGPVGLQLKQIETQLLERAQRDEFAERDRREVEGLEETLGVTRSFVEADPARRDEMRAEGERVIDLSRITPAEKDRLKRKFGKELDKTAVLTRIMRAQTAEDFNALKRDLAPDAADRRVSLNAPILDRAPSASQRREIRRQGGVVVNLDTNWARGDRQTGPLVVIPDNATAAQRQAAEAYAQRIAEVYQSQFGSSLPPRVLTRSENGRGRGDTIHTEPFSVNDRRAVQFFQSDEGRRLHASILSETLGQIPGVHFSVPHDPDKGDPGAGGPAGSEVDFARALLAELRGSDPDATTYGGPYGTLSITERRAYWSQVEAQRRKLVGEVETAIKAQMGVAAEGYAPPQPILDDLAGKVASLGDTGLTAQFAAMIQKVDLTQSLQKAPPGAIEDLARAQRDAASTRGATKEQVDAIAHIEKVGQAVRKEVDQNPLGWAQRTGIEVPLADGPPGDLEPRQRAQWQMPTGQVQLERLNFGAPDIADQLGRRLDQAIGVARYYGQPVKAFTPIERESLKTAVRAGGPVLLHTLGHIARAASEKGIAPELVMQEVAGKDAPEIAMVGDLVANAADPALLDTAAKAIQWKVGMKEGFKSTIDRLQAEPALGEAAAVLGTQPTKVDSVRALANLVYEYEARQEGLTAFNAGKYKEVVARLMGQTTDPVTGVTYGGVGTQGGSWTLGWSKANSQVLVPHGVRTDSFDQLLQTLRAEDLVDIGMPVYNDGATMPMSALRQATWVSVGFGRYAIQVDEDADGTRVMARDAQGRAAILDLRPVLGKLRERNPEIFAGYNAYVDQAKTVPDPELPSWYTGN